MKTITTLLIMICCGSFIAHAGDMNTKAAVTLAGGIIKAKNTENITKYKRKKCPVCKGKGWYMSGDDISRVECGYCEPEDETQSEVIHPPIILQGPNKTKQNPKCNGPQCNQPPITILKR